MTVAYVIALTAIAILSIASHFVLADTLRTNEGSAAVINLSGRQRMLSQRIVALALEVRHGDESARAPLRTAISEFGTAHQKLVHLSNTADPVIAARLNDTYYGAIETDAQVQHFLEAARAIAASPPGKMAPGKIAPDSRPGAYTPEMAVLVTSARGPLLKGLEQVVSIHQAESEARTRHLEWIQWAILSTVLATLLIEALFIFRPMVARISAYLKQLIQLADNDYLTGIPNRRAFTNRALSEIERSRRHGRALSLLLVDADHFKRVNDVHGHPAGDAVLIALATMLHLAARTEDIVGRIGGEEFALLLPETSPGQASVLAERLRQAVAQAPLDADGVPIAMTISIGIASVPLAAKDPFKSAMQTADTMLYHAKESGRNCIWPNLSRAVA